MSDLEIKPKDIEGMPSNIPKTRTYIVGEIGINHNGNLNNALRLIDVAAFAGCRCVKFQKRNPDVCVPGHQKNVMRDAPWGRITYLEYRYRIEFGKKEYDQIDAYCRKKNIAWAASVWDLDSLEFILNYDIPFIKIPSAMVINKELIREACRSGRDVWVSTGMSEEREVDEAVALLKKYAKDFLLMHCNSSYPAHVNELNLRYIQTMKRKYNCRVGYSGHEFELITSIVAMVLGAEAIERHITLDRTQWGSDQLASVEPHGLLTLMNGIFKIEKALGDGEKRLWDSERKIREKLRGV